MVDFARFGIALIDKVSAPAREAADELDRIEQKLKKSKTLMALTNSEVKKLASSRVGGKIASVFDGAAGSVTKFALGGAAAATAAGVALGAMVTKSVVGMGLFADASRRAFASLTGDAQKGSLAFDTAVSTAKQLGLDVQTTVGQFQKLLAMQFSLADAEDQVKLAADLQAVGTSAENTQRALVAMTQIKAKGKLQAEELVGQLAEAGVATTLVYAALSKQLGKTEADVKKLISSGKVTADQGIAAIKSAIMAKVHEHKTGEAAERFSQSSLQGLMQRMQGAPNRLWLRVAEGIAGSLSGLGRVMQQIEQYIDNIDAKAIGEFVTTILDGLVQMVPLAMEFASGFAEGFKELVGGMQGFSTGKDALKLAREFGKDFAKFLGQAAATLMEILRVVRQILPIINAIGVQNIAIAAIGVKFAGAAKPVWDLGKGILQAVLKTRALRKEASMARAALDLAMLSYTDAQQGKSVPLRWDDAPSGLGKVGKMDKVKAGLGKAGGGIATFFKTVGKWIMKIGPWLIAAWQVASTWIIGTMWPAITGLFSGAGAAIVGFFAAIPLALVGAIAAAIASVAYLGYVIWKNWDELGRAFSYVWDQICAKVKALAGAIVEAIKSGLGALGNWFMNVTGGDTTNGGIAPNLQQPTLSPQAAGVTKTENNVKANFTVNVNGNQPDGAKVGEAAATTLQDKTLQLFEHHALAQGT